MRETVDVREHDRSLPCDLSKEDLAYVQAVRTREAGIVLPNGVSSQGRAPLPLSILRKSDRHVVSVGAIVGTIGLPSGRIIRISPKLGSNIGVLWCLAKSSGMPTSWLRDAELPLGTHFFDVLALLLAKEVTLLVKHGIRKDYVEVEEPLSMLRGRLLPAATMTASRGRPMPIVCRHDEFTLDVFHNQVLRLALRRSEQLGNAASEAARRADALLRDEVGLPPMPDVAALRKLRLARTNRNRQLRNYECALRLAELVLTVTSPGDFSGRRDKAPTVLLNMASLFERALREILNKEFGQEASGIGPVEFVAHDSGVSLRFTGQPDIPVRGLIVDAKYKQRPLAVTMQGNRTVIAGDFYQASYYAGRSAKPVALVYAVGSDWVNDFSELPVVANELDPRVGVLPLCIAGDSVDDLESASRGLIQSLYEFRNYS